MAMITKEFASHFAQEWIEAWNAHDLDRILEHYSDDFEMTSPLIVSSMSVASGTLKGKQNIREYWAKGLSRFPDLNFKLDQATYSIDTIALYYDAILGRKAIEWFLFDEHGKVIKSNAHYNET